MTDNQFLNRCELLWPGKPITADQRILYLDKMLRFTASQLDRMFDRLSETIKFFPKVSDIYDVARALGFLVPAPVGTHKWTATECVCGGSGQLAAFYSELIDRENGYRELTLERLTQYDLSMPIWHETQFVRYFFRCSCDAGNVETLPKGPPRWDLNKPNILRVNL